jgi:sterol carrier protein 2
VATARELMLDAHQKLTANASEVTKIGAVYKFVLDGEGGGTWIMNLKDNVGVSEGDGAADCTIRMSASDYVEMREGRQNPQMLFFQARLQIEGDIGLAMKLQNLTDVLR